MIGTLDNIWLKRIISLINLIYVFVIGIFAYASFLYELEIKSEAVSASFMQLQAQSF